MKEERFRNILKIWKFTMLIVIINIIMPLGVIEIFNEPEDILKPGGLKISLYIKETGDIESIDFEEYVKQVTYAEMPASFCVEAIKAQAIAVRSYTYRKLKTKAHNNCDMCNDITHCQAWKKSDNTENYKKVAQAVESTRGKVAVYKGEVINAVYHASSGGYTEDATNVWAGSGEEYLISTESLLEENVMNDFSSEVTIKAEDFFKKLNLNSNKKVEIKVLSKTEGNRVKEVLINNTIFTGSQIREIFDLKSCNFNIICRNGKIIFLVKGYGHGVGMSQWGAQAMALEGKNCNEIIKYYYRGVEIKEYGNI